MSLCTVAFLNNGKQIAIGADSRACTYVDGVIYQLSDDNVKLYSNEEGLTFYCSGLLTMSEEVAEKLLKLEPQYLHTPNILEILETTYSKYMKSMPEINKIKHALQLVILVHPNKEGDVYKIVYFDSENNFTPYIARVATDKVYVFAIGKGMHIAQPLLEELLSEKKENGAEIQVFDAFLAAYSAASAENCGGTLNYMAFLDEQIIVEKNARIVDKKEIRRYDNLMAKGRHDEGDGIIKNEEGEKLSGRAFMCKPNGSWELA